MMADSLTLSDSLVAELESSDGVIVVHLSKAPIDPAADGVDLATVVEATFPGYAPFVLHFEPCDVDGDEYAEMASEECVFESTVVVETQLIYFAYAVYEGADGLPRIMGVYEFAEPLRVCADSQQISTGAWRVTKLP